MRTYHHVQEDTIQALQEIVGAKYVYTDKDKKIPYASDEGVGTGKNCLPEVVVLPKTTEEVSAVMKLANEALIPVVPRGAGTGLEFGAVVNELGGIVLSTERMNQILEFDADKMYMVVEPGVITAQLQVMAKEKGLLYA